MRAKDMIILAYKSLWTHKLRTSLLILSVIIGVAAIVALTAQTEGIGKSIISSLQKLGPDTLIFNVFNRRLTDADVALIRSLDGVRDVIPIIRSEASVNIGGNIVSATIYGINIEDLEKLLGDIKVINGEIYQDSSAPMALVGYQLAYSNSSDTPMIIPGQMILVATRGGFFSTSSATASLIVSGVLDSYGSMFLISPDTSIFISLQAASKMLRRTWYDMLIIKVSDPSYLDMVSETLRNIYGSTASVTSPTQIIQTTQNIVIQLSILLGGIAAISLATASLGVLNMMIVTVTERTREIGTLKALGFKDRHILMQILFEGLIIGLVGGVLGVIIGVAVSYMLPNILGGSLFRGFRAPMNIAGRGFGGGVAFSYTPYINPLMMLVAFALAPTVSVISSLYPAWRASKMDPVRALRYE